jgi:hypothetical protein
VQTSAAASDRLTGTAIEAVSRNDTRIQWNWRLIQ